MFRLLISAIIFFFFAVSCVKDKPVTNNSVVKLSSKGVYVLNEGNFMFGNASISYYNTTDSMVQDDVFKKVNNKSLGDVCQSVFVNNDLAFLVVNNSGKIEVVNTYTMNSVATIENLQSPRYIAAVGNKAYVSDLYANAIAIVDLKNFKVIGSIPCNGWTEEMIFSNGKLFVCNKKSNKMYVVNILKEVIEDSVIIAFGANSIREDKNGQLWVLCAGSENTNNKSTLFRVDPLQLKVEQSFSFTNQNAWRLKINASKDTLYYLNKGVYKMPIISSSAPTLPFIEEGNKNFYALGVDPKSGEIYVSNAIDYIQKSMIYRYNVQGKLLHTFKAGIISTDFWFKE